MGMMGMIGAGEYSHFYRSKSFQGLEDSFGSTMHSVRSFVRSVEFYTCFGSPLVTGTPLLAVTSIFPLPSLLISPLSSLCTQVVQTP